MSRITTSVSLASAVEVAKESAHACFVQPIRLIYVDDGEKNEFHGEISVKGCRLSSEKLNRFLTGISNGELISSLTLDVRGNYHDDETVNIVCGLIHKISSLNFHKLNSNGLERLLQRVRDDRVKLDVLDISGSAVSDVSLNHLKELIKCRKITTKLNLEGCEGAYRPLIVDDRSNLNEIYQRNKRHHNLKIKWFKPYSIPKEFVSQPQPEMSNADDRPMRIGMDNKNEASNYRTLDSGISEDCMSELSLTEVEVPHSTPLKAEPIRDIVHHLPIRIMSHILFQKDREFSVMIWPNNINGPMTGTTRVIDMMEKSGFKIIHPISEFASVNDENVVSLECTNIPGLYFTPPGEIIRDVLQGMTCRNIKFRLDGDCLERIRTNGEDVDIIYTTGDTKIPICVRLQKRDQQSERANKEINVHIGDSKVSANTYTGRHGVINSTQDGVTNVTNV